MRSKPHFSTECSSFVDCLRQRAEERPTQPAYTFLSEGEVESASLTYAELDHRSRELAAELHKLGARGQRALLLYPPSLEFIVAFFGCLYEGVVAVPSFPPKLRRADPRLLAIARDARPKVALTTSAILSKAETFADLIPELGQVDWLATDTLNGSSADSWQEPPLSEESLAFLQYTSGSTSSPKGVMVSHGNLLHNEEMIRQAFEQSEDSVIIGWLPLQHDMGLIGNVLQPIYLGTRSVLMPPLAFLQKPVRWLQAITRYRATTSGGPNFAYELCLRKISAEQREPLDLSSWKVAFNGSEPVRAATLERFLEVFGSCGFRREAFYPCYGLAEATLFAAGGTPDAPPVIERFRGAALERNHVVSPTVGELSGRSLVGCGSPHMGQRIVIVDPETEIPCPGDQVGEIWISGPSVARGYWDRAEETERVFRASVGSDGGDSWLRTGDLGFLRDGQLFVTGRLKDLIILRGRNYYPQDIERCAESAHQALRPGCGAAFSVDVDEEERLVLVHERERHQRAGAEAVAEAVRRAISEEHDTQLFDLTLVRTGSVPKTSSGKVQRHLLKAAYQAGELAVVGRSTLPYSASDAAEPKSDCSRATILALEGDARRTSVESFLRQRVAWLLRVPPERVAADAPLSSLGLDSLVAMEIKNDLESGLGVSVSLPSLLEGTTIATLGLEILNLLHGSRSSAAVPPLAAAEPGAESPLSQGQEALWFMDRLARDSGALHIVNAARLKAGVDIDALRRCLQALCDRHPALRTVFIERQGEPVQRVHETTRVDFVEHDASDWSVDTFREELLREAYRPFDLEQGPLLRFRLFRRSLREQILLLAIHHIVSDLWSLTVLVEELGVLYGYETGGAAVELEPLPIQYTDFVHWQRQLLEGSEGERLWAYWRQQLAGELPELDLPTDRPRPAVSSYHGASQALRLDADLSAAIQGLSNRQQATLYTTLVAAFQVLLYRYTGQSDLLVGSPTAGRDAAELAPLVGYFVNPLILRADCSGNPSFEAFLLRARQTVLSALGHAGLPFASLVERLQPIRDPSRSPILQVMFVFQNADRDASQGLAAFALGEAGETLTLSRRLVLESVELQERRTQFDLTLVMAETRGELRASFEYDVDLFDAVTARRLLAHFRNLLAEIVADPRQPITAAPLLATAERHQLLLEWNATAGEAGGKVCLHRLVEAQVDRTPDAIAVVFGDQSLSYRDLDRRANQLAHHLLSLEVAPEARIGFCLERSLEMVVGLLGILKAGGAYVPIDPDYPEERRSFLLQDSQARVLLTLARMRQTWPSDGAHPVFLDLEWPRIAVSDASRPAVSVGYRNLAYAIYTSGTTGQPKGVMVSHGGIASTLIWRQTAYPLRATDGVLQAVSIGFDPSVWEFFGPLLAGARLALAQPGGHLDSSHLAALIRQQRITVFQRPASMLEALLREEALGSGAFIRHVICGGEPLTIELQQSFFGRLAGQLNNLYGPAEGSLEVTRWICDSASHRRTVPIGRPIAGKQTYLLDPSLAPLPFGLQGEIHIGSEEGLARGYLDRPRLTAEMFIPNPHCGVPGTRLYRTGDLARHLPDGNLDFLGRFDQQVKIRGCRVELGEIELVLRQHRGVRQAAVTFRENADGGRLAAYIVPDPDGAPAVRELRAFVRRRLPSYMVPGAFVVLDALPLTPHGKVDQRALPEPDSPTHGTGDNFVAARTPLEELLAEIWGDLLRLEAVSVEASFFDLGGHSLLATQLLSRVREAFGVALPLRTLFEAVTIAELARRIEIAILGQGASFRAPQIERVSRHGELALSFTQQRLWFIDQMEPASAAYNIPGMLRLEGKLDVAALRGAVDEILRRHEALRTSFPSIAGRGVQKIAPPRPLDLPSIDLMGLTEADRELVLRRLAREEARRPFELAGGPLLRLRLLCLGPTRYAMLSTAHHIISDGWSTGIFIRELAALYMAGLEGRSSPLTELPIQYADFAQWQRRWLQGEELDTLLSYWRSKLMGAPAVLELPTDRPRPAERSYRGARCALRLGTELSRGLLQLSRSSGATVFMTLLAAFKTVLYRYAGRREVSVGTPVAGRNQVRTEGLIGPFVNTLVLRTDLRGKPSFQELLGRVRETVLGAHAQQELPFEMLLDELGVERSLEHTPLFQVMFALQMEEWTSLELPGLRIELLESDTGTAKFDLTLSMVEREGGLQGYLEYGTELFDATSVLGMVAHLRVLLGGIIDCPEQSLSDLPLLTEAELHQLLVDWNDRRPGSRREEWVHRGIEVRAEECPDAVAVILRQEYLTYRELLRRADRLSLHLRARGVGPELLVGVSLDRSPDLVVALLGILKAGGSYLPLDPTDPRERLLFMLRDARVSVLITLRRHLERLSGHRATVVCLDDLWHAAEPEPAVAVRGLSAASLAYVIYTSGTTGRPKAVMVDHGSISRHCADVTRFYGLGSRDRMLQFASLSFDVSLEQILMPLGVGATLILRDDEVWSTSDMRRQTKVAAPTVLNLPPAYWQQLASEPSEMTDASVRHALRLVNVGGDVLLPEPVRVWQRTPMGTVRLLNSYGPTETTITATSFEIPATFCDDPALARIPIGRPLSCRTAHVLDLDLNPVPVGVSGQLHLGGPLVARGYLGRPALTAEKFLPDPFGLETGVGLGSRLYRTGDLVRWRADGNLEFLGRIDQQVKVRGFRIELGEIEAALTRHPSVREALVLAFEPRPGDKRLAAYLVTSLPKAPADAEMRSFLSDRLPDHMIPSGFVSLVALPLTPSGKVDRSALPRPQATASDEGYVSPRTPAEERLAAIWARVLGIDQVGVHDNFFQLGGDSILSIQIVSRATRENIHITPKQIFQFPTVAQLSSAATATAVAAEQGPVTGAVPLTPIQHSFFHHEPANPHHFNQAVLLAARGPLDAVSLGRAVEHLMLHHDALRLRFIREASGWQQRIASPGGSVPVTTVDLSELLPAERNTAMEQAIAGFHAGLDLEAGPILRVALFDRGSAQASRLLFVVHHLAVDGVSWRILLEDLETAYTQQSRGEAITLSPKTTSWKRWAEQLSQYATSEALDPERDYWLAEGWLPMKRLPVDHRKGANTVASIRTFTLSFTTDETRDLLRMMPRVHGTEINDVLLAALASSFFPWTGSRSLSIDLESHGREGILDDVDLSRTVGWFTSVFPVRLDLGDARGPKKSLHSIRERLRHVPNRGLGYEVLRQLARDSEVTRQLRSQPRPEVAFNYLGQLDQVLEASPWFAPAPESSGPARDPGGLRAHLLEIEGAVREGRLRIGWSYSESFHRPRTIEKLARDYAGCLRSLLSDARAAAARQTPGAAAVPNHTAPAAMEKEAYAGSDDQAIAPAPDRIDLPLSFAQRRLWFLDQLEPGSAIYNIPVSVSLTGALDRVFLEQSLDEVLRRHESLRTTFAALNGNPVQIISPAGATKLPTADLRNLPELGRRAEADRLAKQEAWRPFDLARGPLVRFVLLCLRNDVYELLTTVHHIVADGWSMGLFFSEVSVLYEAFRAGRPSPLVELSIQYPDFAYWQRRLQGGDLEAQLAYWKRRLEGAPQVLALPTDRRRPAVQSHRGAIHSLILAEEVAEKLRAFSLEQEVTPYITLLTAYKALLFHYTHRVDLVVGSPSANRNRPEIEGLIGCFVNLLVLRTDLSGDPAFREFLRRVREVAMDAYTHQDLPYEKLVEELQLARDPSRNPLVQVVFTFENTVRKLPSITGLDLRLRSPDFNTALFDLALIMESSPRGLIASMRYMTDLFQPASIDRMLWQFEVLLGEAMARPELRLGELSELLANRDHRERIDQEQQLASASIQKLKLARRKAVRGSSRV